MLPGLYPETSLVWGDTWVGIPFIGITLNTTNAPPPVNAASVVMTFRSLRSAHRVSLTLSSADGDITITDANAWTFVIPPQELALPRPDTTDTYQWSIQFTDVDGFVQTYLEGTLNVVIQSTR